MKHTLGFVLAAGLVASVNGGTFTNESPAGSQGMKIIWAVPTNVWPVDNIWSYKVIPQEFSDAVISNAMAIGSFMMKDKKKLPPEALAIDKNAMRFDNKDETKELVILPTLGYIDYRDETAEAGFTRIVKDSVTNFVHEPVVGVPNQEETTQLGLKYLQQLGVDIDDIARKPNSSDFDLHWSKKTGSWTDPKTKKEIDEVLTFGVFFTRRIDGIEGSGFGDFYIEFGNNAKIFELKLSWRNLQPYQLNDNFIKPEQIVKSIRNGQTPLPRLTGWPLDEIKTLTITNAIPRYGRKPGDQPMDFVVPALQLDAIIDNGKTNIPIWFQMGISPPKP
ncbi:MAG: hypothetical protein ACLQSR_17200 [Limisphaerales bacterium]